MSSFSHLFKRWCARRGPGALLLTILLTLALNGCGGGGFLVPGTSPSATATKASTATPTPKPGNAFAYAFARDGQIWVAQAGKAPQQLTQLPASNAKSINALSWSPDGKHLAFEVAGVGNPVDYAIDASTGNLTALNVPSTTTAASFGWSDNNTVITIKQVGGNTQFWKTNITNNSAGQITQIDGTPPVQVVGNGIFYSVFDSSSNQLMLHRWDVGAGSEGTPIAITPAGTSSLKVNWDVSPDGSQVLTGFRLATPDSTWGNGFWSVNYSNSADRSPVFTDDEIPFANFKDTDTVTLSFSPDGQTVFIDTTGAVGPTSEQLDGTDFTTYTPAVGITSLGDISWSPNSHSFVLNSTGTTTQATIYTVASKTAGTVFADKATLLQWSPQS